MMTVKYSQTAIARHWVIAMRLGTDSQMETQKKKDSRWKMVKPKPKGL